VKDNFVLPVQFSQQICSFAIGLPGEDRGVCGLRQRPDIESFIKIPTPKSLHMWRCPRNTDTTSFDNSASFDSGDGISGGGGADGKR